MVLMAHHNEQIVHQLRQIRDDVTEQLKESKFVTLKPTAIELAETFSYNGSPFSLEAEKKMYDLFSVKPKFKNLMKKMDHDDSEKVMDLIKSTVGDRSIYARKTKTLDSKGNLIEVVSDIYVETEKNIERNETNFLITTDEYFETLEEALLDSEIEYELHNQFSFVKNLGEITLQLVNKNSTLNVFSDQEDNWKHGVQFSFNPLKFTTSPFFQRLVCTNGTTAKSYGKNLSIDASKFSINKVKTNIRNMVVTENPATQGLLAEAAIRLKNTNVSIGEFLHFKKLIGMSIISTEESSEKDEKSHLDQVFSDNKVLGKMFDDLYLYKSYGDIDSKTNKWKATANSGKNAYRFMNDLTWIASHPKESMLSEELCLKIQIEAGNLMFKKQLDLEAIAPKVDFDTINYISE